jgi:hypothetical protein
MHTHKYQRIRADALDLSYAAKKRYFFYCSLNNLFGFLFHCDNLIRKKKNFIDPVHVFNEDDLKRYELKYYNSEIHKASYMLPTSFRNVK